MIKINKGQSLVEIILVMGLAAILLPALLTGFVISREGKAQQGQRFQALTIAKEAAEAVRSVRNRDWATFAQDGTYYHLQSGSSWTLAPGSTTINGFTESIVISDVYRDGSDNIVQTAGTLDPSTKKVDITISWTLPYPSSGTTSLYLTRLKNLSFTDTTISDFNRGTPNNVAVQQTAGSYVGDGEIVLSQTGGFGDWCNPASTPAAQLSLAGGLNAVSANQGSGNVISFVGSGNSANGLTFADISITDPAYPTQPVASIAGAVSNTPQIKTNGAYNDPNYGYLAADQHSNGGQGVIVNLSNNSIIAYLDLGSSGNGQSIYALNNVAFLTDSKGNLYTFNLTTPNLSSCTNGSPCHYSPEGSTPLAGVGHKVIVVGTNAYIATTSTSTQFQIVDVTTASSPKISASVSVGNGQGATDVFVDPTQLRAYIVTSYSSSQPDFFTIDVNPTDVSWYKQIVSTFTTKNSMNPTGVAAVSGAKAIIVGTGSTKNYQVIALSSENYPNPPALSTCGSGGLNTSYNINAISTLFTQAKRTYSYIITDDAGHEFKIIEGGPGAGNGNYVPTGTFISGPFGPTTLSTAFNNFVANFSQPQANDVQIYMAVADPVGGSCTNANYTFVGINGTAMPFQTVTTGNTSIFGTIPYGNYPPNYKNPDKCFEYKVVLITPNSILTPVFKDMTVNYSP